MIEDAHSQQSLDDVLAQCWHEIAVGASSAKHGFHQPVIATVAADGRADARMVVLRGVDPDNRFVWCHTDARAPKVTAIAENPSIAWAFYCRERRMQIRVRGIAEVILDGAMWERAWANTQMSARRCYLAPRAPGTVSAEPDNNLPLEVRNRVPEEHETEPGRAHFSVLKTTVRSIDCLQLAHNGHTRSRFIWDDADQVSSDWVAV